MADLTKFLNLAPPFYVVHSNWHVSHVLNTVYYGLIHRGGSGLYGELGNEAVELTVKDLQGNTSVLDSCWYFNTPRNGQFIFGRDQYGEGGLEWGIDRDIVGIILEKDWKGPNNMNVRILRPGECYD